MITLKISQSSHPEFDLFADARINGRQVARRGNRAEIDTFAAQLVAAAEKINIAVSVVDES